MYCINIKYEQPKYASIYQYSIGTNIIHHVNKYDHYIPTSPSNIEARVNDIIPVKM